MKILIKLLQCMGMVVLGVGAWIFAAWLTHSIVVTVVVLVLAVQLTMYGSRKIWSEYI